MRPNSSARLIGIIRVGIYRGGRSAASPDEELRGGFRSDLGLLEAVNV